MITYFTIIRSVFVDFFKILLLIIILIFSMILSLLYKRIPIYLNNFIQDLFILDKYHWIVIIPCYCLSFTSINQIYFYVIVMIPEKFISTISSSLQFLLVFIAIILSLILLLFLLFALIIFYSILNLIIFLIHLSYRPFIDL
jgi:hypothetical protein